MSLYESLKAIHILAVAIWFGAGFLQLTLAYRFRTERDVMARQIEFAGARVFPVAAALSLLSGIALMIDGDISLGEPWILIAIAGWLATMFTGAVLLDRAVKALLAGAEGAYERILLVSRIDLLVLAIVVVDMVAKPD